MVVGKTSGRLVVGDIQAPKTSNRSETILEFRTLEISRTLGIFSNNIPNNIPNNIIYGVGQPAIDMVGRPAGREGPRGEGDVNQSIDETMILFVF